jgi:hypothetical protein
MAAFSGFYESHEHPPLGKVHDSTTALRWTSLFWFAVALAAAGAILSE